MKKICFFLVIVLIILSVILFSVENNNNLKVKKKEEVKIKEKIKTDNVEYKLKDGETFIKKTKTGMNLTKYNGAYYVNGIMIVNKTYNLDSTYTPLYPYKEITSDYLYGADYIDKTTYLAFLDMQRDAKKAGYNLYLSSGYRSYKVQVDLYNNYVARDGKNQADTYSARPGYSEHQSGLCFDMNGTNANFFNTDIGKWVFNNYYKYGFILRFPEGKENETGYQFEAWHYRYVGKSLAKKLYNNGDIISLESYLGVSSNYSG